MDFLEAAILSCAGALLVLIPITIIAAIEIRAMLKISDGIKLCWIERKVHNFVIRIGL